MTRQPPVLAVLTAALAILLPIATHATTTVERGDVLRVEVVNAPEFSRPLAPVDVDGRIALPALGTVEVAGRETDTISSDIAGALKAAGILVAPVVLVEVAAYRQVYVGGQVGHPGAIDFVPGMTARQAIVAVGGARIGPPGSAPTPGETLSVIAERQATAFALAQVVSRIARLQAQLDQAATLAPPTRPAAVAPDVLDRAAAAETAMLTDLRHRAVARQQHAQDLLELIDLEIDTLARQAALQDTETDVQMAEIQDARSLVERGLLPRPRLQELLREQSQLSRDRLETSAFSARARQEAETVRFELQKERSQEREAMRLNLQEARRAQAGLEAKIKALDLRIMAGGLTAGAATGMRLTIHRSIAGKGTGFEAGLDDPVMPGDVLELTLVPAPAPGPDSAMPASFPTTAQP